MTINALAQKMGQEMKNDDGERIAFRYIGPERKVIYDDRVHYMVRSFGGGGKMHQIVDEVFPSVEFARENGYSEDEYEPIGEFNIYADKLGYVSENNTLSEPALKGKALQKAIEDYYLSDSSKDALKKDECVEEALQIENAAKEFLRQQGFDFDTLS